MSDFLKGSALFLMRLAVAGALVPTRLAEVASEETHHHPRKRYGFLCMYVCRYVCMGDGLSVPLCSDGIVSFTRKVANDDDAVHLNPAWVRHAGG